MKKEEFSDRQKDSKPAAPVVITEDTCCVVNFLLPGAFKDRQSNANTKEEIRKMKLSPILDENKKGRFICYAYNSPGRKLAPGEKLPRNFYMGSTNYNPPTYHNCSERRVYNSESLKYLSSVEIRPFGFTKKQWEGMSIKDRLAAQFALDASYLNPANPSFTFEFVN